MFKYSFALLLFFFITCFSKNICIVSDDPDTFNPLSNMRDAIQRPSVILKQKLQELGHIVSVIRPLEYCNKDTDCILFFTAAISIVKRFNNTKAKKIYFSNEPPLVNSRYLDNYYKNKFDKIFILIDDFVDKKKMFKFFYPQPYLNVYNNDMLFSQRKFCTMVSGYHKSNSRNELYSERIKIVNFFEKYYPQDFEFYGVNWPKNYKCYKGPISNKRDYLKNYKFCICYENSRYNGYITEKIFDVMVSGCIPIYYGAYNIRNYIPGDCFIDRSKFSTDEELYRFLKHIDENQFNLYLNNIKKFLASEKAQNFSIDKYVKVILFAIS